MTRPGPAFSNSDDFEPWEERWCARCRVDAAFREGRSSTGCDLILLAMCGDRTPVEWLPQPEASRDRYVCVNFRGPDDPDLEPRPQPEPPDMDGLFERPERAVRMLTQPSPDHVAVGGV